MNNDSLICNSNATPSTTAIGDALRDHVIDLLEAEGHKVSREVRVNSKKIDVLLEIDDEFKPRKIAIECKNIGKNLSQGELTAIYADHLHLIERKEISELFVIVRLDFSPEAKGYADQTRGLQIFTIREFEESLLGYRKYCREVRDLFSEAGLEEYYIQSSVEGGDKLHDKIMEWLNGAEKAPAAILGGYGMGKTSYCRYLTRVLADGYLAGTSSRVPILVRLSDIATHTDVDGLIAKTLADRYQTKNYSFAKFKKLNRQGKFVVIFDGFDEMKHALSWADFKYNFSQLHTLLEGNAKVLVAGRPNAFMSDDEHAWILRGERKVGGQSTRVPGEWKYLEYEISQFSEQDVSEFLHRYLRHNLPPSIAARGSSEEWISERIADFDKIRANGDLYRPVHLKIYADVAADPEVTLQSFTTYGLYTIAATRISEREGDKAVRKQIDANQRQKVIERIAWWLWDEYSGRRLFFIPDVVPEAVIGRDLLNNPVYERENIYREIFTGSFLERKFGQNYYFSHRSFLEFFVALRLENAEKNAISINSIFKNINPEILAFLKQSPSYDEFLAYIYKSLQRFSGEMPALLVEEMVAYCASRGMADAQMAIQIMLRYFPFMRPGKEESSALIRMMTADLASNNLEHREIALYFILTALRAREVDHEVFLSLLVILAKAVNWAGFRAKVNDATITKYTYTRKDMGEYIFVRFVRVAAEMARSGQPLVSFDISKAFDEMHDKRAPKIAIGGLMALPTHGPLRFEFTEVMRDVAQRDTAVALEVLRTGVY